MVKHVTVYELIQELTQYPADKYVEFETLATPGQLKGAEEDLKRIGSDYICLGVDKLDLKSDVYEEYGTVFITMYPKNS